MSIEYITTCDNCKKHYAFESGWGYIPFYNTDFCKSWIDSLGNSTYRDELNSFLKENKDFESPLEHALYGCQKCKVIYNLEILCNFKPDFEFKCKNCNIPLIKLEMGTVNKNHVEYVKFYDSAKNDFKCKCVNCNKELLGIIYSVIYKD